jgi:ribosomal 50S subunit-recycling heat shock protein
MADDGRRVDVWLWQARFCKTRAAASRLADSGVIRLTRGGHETRLDKASRTVRSGDQLVFAVSGRIAAIRVLSLGVRRGPPAEARTLYETLGGDLSPPNTAGAEDGPRHPDADAGGETPPRH